MPLNAVHVLPVEVVRAGHRPVPVEVLSPHLITWTLTVGDVIVGAGTLLLALFTWRLARVIRRAG